MIGFNCASNLSASLLSYASTSRSRRQASIWLASPLNWHSMIDWVARGKPCSSVSEAHARAELEKETPICFNQLLIHILNININHMVDDLYRDR